MARLIVQAHGTDGLTDPGDRDQAAVLLSITDPNGEPVTGIGATNVRVDAMIVAPYGAGVNVVRVYGSTLPGFYRIDLVPSGTYTWKAGEYDIAVSVTQGTSKGQALATSRVS